MKLDLNITDDELTIYCSEGLKDFSKEFINYYKENINYIKTELGITDKPKLVVAITDKEEDANFVYGKNDFAGLFTDTGAFAYINLAGKKSKEYMLKGLMHELTHHLYKHYVYGKDKERITWVDEGLAQLLSKQKDNLTDEKYYDFLKENLKLSNTNLNELNHNDKSFGNRNGYNLSYIAIRYLHDTNNHEEFIDIISSQDKLLEIGPKIIENVKEYYEINSKEGRLLH